jgi:hypothetical protein
MQTNNQDLPSISEDEVAGFTISRSLDNKMEFDVFAVDKNGQVLYVADINLDFDTATAYVEAANSTFPVEPTILELVEIEMNGDKRFFNATR